MAPIRRYLRITKYSILEVRIYLDNPSLAESWLLNRRSPVLPRVIEAVRPLVLPKLREEKERKKAKSKKKGIKDVVVQDDFEVSIFLTETGTSHSLLTKQKLFTEPAKERAVSNFDRITGAGDADDSPIVVEDAVLGLRMEDSDDDIMAFQDIPSAEDRDRDNEQADGRRRSKRLRGPQDSEDSDSMFVEQDDAHLPKRHKNGSFSDGEGDEDKKKMALKTTYDGFSIYGRILCLVVKKRDTGKEGGKQATAGGGRTMMEDWIVSTQMPAPLEDYD